MAHSRNDSLEIRTVNFLPLESMTETLFHAYTPLILWTGLGVILFRLMPEAFPRLLGRTLYWVGVPIEILSLARQTDFSGNAGLAPLITAGAILMGFLLAWLSLKIWQHLVKDQESSPSWLHDRASQGSFILSAMLGNTGFVGLAIAPSLISDRYVGWAVFYSVTQNVIGTYGLGVFIASYFGRQATANHWWIQIRDILSVPSLWAFAIGSLTRSIELPVPVESGLHASLWFVIPGAFVLMGMRLSQIKGWKTFQTALLPAILKVIVMPGLLSIVVTLLGLTGDSRLALVLMSGMPSAFAGLILAEEYNLDREIVASSIVITTGLLLLMIPLWLLLYS
jgi:predicted permease